MHIVILNQFYHPDVAATAQLASDLGTHLVSRGHQVTAVASVHRYAGAEQALPMRHAGVDIVRVGGTRFGRGNRLLRGADYLSFAAAALPRIASLRQPDVVIALTTPPFIGAIGALLKPIKRCRLVLWVMDVYPDIAVELGALPRGGLVGAALMQMERGLVRAADAVVALDDEMARVLVAHGAPAEHVHVIDNWAGDDIQPLPLGTNPLRAELGLSDTFTVSYSGNFGYAHDFETVADAAERLRDDPMHWLIIGDGPQRSWFESRLRSAGIAGVSFLQYQPRSALNAGLTAAHTSLVLLRERFAGLVVPSKLYGLLAAGVPILYVGPRRGRVAEVIEAAGVGLGVENGDAAGLAAAIRRMRLDESMRSQMAGSARRLFDARFRSGLAMEKFETLLTRVVGTGKAKRGAEAG